VIHIKSGECKPRRDQIGTARLHLIGEWRLRVRHLDGREDDYGVVSRKIVTAVALTELLNVLAAGTSAALGDFHFHALGTGTSPESSSDTHLAAEVGVRTAGTQQVSNKQYITAATIISTVATNITEAGIFSGNNILLDRSKFAAVPVTVGEQIFSTYTLTPVGS
jgi:hypothetical protein